MQIKLCRQKNKILTLPTQFNLHPLKEEFHK